MSNGGMNRRDGFFHHRRRRHHTKPEAEFPLCPICQKPVRELRSAIAHRETQGPSHFDCILRILREENSLSESEKICYLGNGSFGIVQFRNLPGSTPRFFVRKRIQYEKTDPIPDWRKQSAQGTPPR
jgi:hypothetical protein